MKKAFLYSIFALFSITLSTTAFAQFQELEIVQQALMNIEQNYYDTAYHEVEDWEALKKKSYQAALGGQPSTAIIQEALASINDPALRYLTETEFNVFFKETMTQEHFGVGLPELFSIDVDEKSKNIVIITPLYGTPAFEAGLLPNDTILTINQVLVKGKSLQEVAQLLRLKEGQVVHLEIARKEKNLVFDLTTRLIKPYFHPFYRVVKYKKQKIGIIWIPQFSAGCSIRIMQILNEMNDQNVSKIVLDLRYNPGGLVNEAQYVAGLFLGERPMAFSQSKNSAIKMLASNGKKQNDLPLTVLVNEGTASSAEALAGILKYYKRGHLIGEPTNGKGLIYSFFTLNDLSTLVVPVGRMKMLDGRDILSGGIVPNEIFKSNTPFILQKKYKKDSLLLYAIKQQPLIN